MLTVKDVFDFTAEDNLFSHHFSNFGHLFLEVWDVKMVEDSPIVYDNIDYKKYVWAACFVHYWCSVLLLPVPNWVYGFKFENPVYSDLRLKAWLDVVTPPQFRKHNYFMSRMDVVYV